MSKYGLPIHLIYTVYALLLWQWKIFEVYNKHEIILIYDRNILQNDWKIQFIIIIIIIFNILEIFFVEKNVFYRFLSEMVEMGKTCDESLNLSILIFYDKKQILHQLEYGNGLLVFH